MKTKISKINLLILAILPLISFNVLADNNKANRDDVKIIKANATEMQISYSPILTDWKIIKTESKQSAYIPNIVGTSAELSNTDNPYQLKKILYISIASPNAIKDFSYEKEIIIIDDKVLAPTPTYIKNENNGTPIAIYKDLHNVITSEKQSFVNVTYAGIIRNRHIAKIEIYPYLPNGNKIRLLKNINITIVLNSENCQKAKPDEMFLSSSILNAGMDNDYIIPQNTNYLYSKNQTTLQNENSNNYLLIEIPKDAIYRITKDDIEKAGGDISNSEINTIKIYGTTGEALSEIVSEAKQYTKNEQNIIVNKNQDGSLKDILFFGSGTQGFHEESGEVSHFLNPYSSGNSYLLTWGNGEGTRAIAKESPNMPIGNTPATYSHHIFAEEDVYNPFPEGGGREWLGNSIVGATKTNQLYNLDRTGEIHYSLNLANKSHSKAYISIYENDILLGNESISSSGGYHYAIGKEFSFSINATKIANDDRSRLMAKYQSSNNDPASIGYWNFYEIAYPRYFQAINNELDFFMDKDLAEADKATEFTINGFSGDIYGFDISNRNQPLLLKNNSKTGGIFKFADALENNEFTHHYYMSGKTIKPNLKKVYFTDLINANKGADIIVIYHKNMQEAAEKYKVFRDEQGKYSTQLASTADIYMQFATGKLDPTAIRNFIIHAYENWENQPKYILLLGDGHYDFRSIHNKQTNLIPAFQTSRGASIFHENTVFATDDYYASISGDDHFVDIAIGRLCVNSNKEADIVINKIINYETKPNYGLWHSVSTFMADDSEHESTLSEGDLYVRDTEDVLDQSMPDFMQIKKIFSCEYPTEFLSGKERRKPSVEEAMLNQINTNGTLILNYIGHSNPRVWSHEEFLERDKTIPKMINKDKLFLCLSASCSFGYFDNPHQNSGAEEMLLNPNGGAIGVVSATRIVYESPNISFTKNFYNALFDYDTLNSKYATMGEAISRAKMFTESENTRKYFLNGDPALSLNIPKYSMEIESIAGILIDTLSEELTLKALDNVEIKGYVINLATKEKINNFNGNGIISLFDGDINKKVIDDTKTEYFYSVYGGALNKSAYKVINGEFTTSFIIPKDISYSKENGRLFVYAYSPETNITAKGFFNDFSIYGINTTGVSDDDGPEIVICLDSREFIEGDYVANKPLLIADFYDASGLNTTGLGIGHRIEAWIDDSPKSIDLTTKFTSSLEDKRSGSSGTVEELLSSFDAGIHKIRIRAWDVYNNYSVQETYFRVKSTDEPVEIVGVINYPNPFRHTTTIKFSHTALPPVDVTINIFNEQGANVRTVNKIFTQMRTAEFQYDGRDNNNKPLPVGAYYYQIIIRSEEINSISSGNMIIMDN